MPNNKYERFTFSMNPNDPMAVMNAKQVELAIKRAVEQLQKEGEKVRRSERYRMNGSINTDYYVPQGVANTALNAAHETLARLGGPSGISFSSASPASMATWSGSIMDAKTRAHIARLVDRSGGMFTTNDQGISSFMIDRARQARNSRGQYVNAYSHISSMINGSNASHVADFESLMNQANFPTSFGSVNNETRADLERAARAIISRRNRRNVSVASEKEEVYARLSARRRRAEYEEQYGIDNPNDPFVRRRAASRKAAMKARRRKNVRGAGKFVGRFITGALAGMLTFLGLSVALLTRIKDAVLELGGNIRGQNMTAQAYNFSPSVVQGWERFATKRGYDKNLLGQSAGALVSKFANPLWYKDSSFEAIAPFLKEDTAALTRMATAGGDENILEMQKLVIQRLTRNSLRGEAGGKYGLSSSQAFSENLEAAKQGLDPATAQLFEKYWYDTRGQVGFDSWRSGNMGPEYGSGTIVHNGATRKAAESTFDSVNNMLGSYKAAGEDVLQVIAGYLKEIVEMFRGLLGGVFEKFFPELALQEQRRNAFNNAKASQLVDTVLPAYQKRAQNVLDRHGIKMGASDVVDAINSGGGGLTTAQLTGLLNDKDYADIVAYANASTAKNKLAGIISDGNKRSYPYTPEQASNAVLGDAWMQSVKIEDILKGRVGEVSLGGFTPAVGGPAALRNKRVFDSVVGSTKKSLETRMKSLQAGMNGDPSSLISATEGDLSALLYYYSVVPGHEAEAEEAMRQYVDFQKVYGGDVEHVFKNGVMRRSLDTSDQDRKIAEARKAMAAWRSASTGGGASASLETRAARWRMFEGGAGARYKEMLDALSNGSLSVPSVPTGMTSVYAGAGASQSGQQNAGNVILNQVIEGQKKTTVVPLKPTANGDRVGDIGGNGSIPYIDAINRAMNKQSN